MLPKTLRWRVQLWHTLLLATIVAILLTAFYRHQRKIIYQAVDSQLRDPIPTILPLVTGQRGGPRRPPPRHPNDPNDRPPQRRRSFPDVPPDSTHITERLRDLGIGELYVITWHSDGVVAYSSPNAPHPLSPLPTREENRTIGSSREAVHFTIGGRIVAVGMSNEGLESMLRRLSVKLTGAGILITGLGFFVGWFITGRSLKPIQQISDQAHRLADGQLTERIKIAEPESELGQLSTVLNETFEKLENSFDQQVRFTADASHEMRTPVSVILAKTEFALARERSSEKYRESLQSCMNSALHMKILVDHLLDLAEIDSSDFALELSSCDLAELIRSTVEFIRPLADQKSVLLSTNLAPTIATIDETRMRQALINLMGNAVKHNLDGGSISVTIPPAVDDFISIAIKDTGEGIPAEHLPHLFGRFYRANKARTLTREGSTGLGLAITQSIIKAHGGEISVESEPGKGSTFTIKLPR